MYVLLWLENFLQFSKPFQSAAIQFLLKISYNESVRAQNHVLSYDSCWVVGRSKNLICPSERPWNQDAKIGIRLTCSLNTFLENYQNVFYQKILGFIDVLSTVDGPHFINL